MKINRQAVYKKHGGHCAYCGRKIEYKQMQVDHFLPKCSAHMRPDSNNNSYQNLLPACQKCNIHKGGMMPETWRSELGKQVLRLQKNAQFDRALRFSQIEITESPIVFYFERKERNG